MRRVACLILLSRAALADPDPALAYPIESTDRPILLPADVWRLDFSLDYSSYLQQIIDANGVTKTIVTADGHTHDGDLALGYSFGPVEINARTLFRLAQLGVAIDLGCNCGVVSAAFEYYHPVAPTVYDYAQYVDYEYKLMAIPKMLSFEAGASMRIAEASAAPMDQMAFSGTVVTISGGVEATMQVVRRLAFSVGINAGGPLQHSAGFTPRASLGSYVGLLFGFHRWDLYAQFGAGDLTRTALPFGAVDFVSEVRFASLIALVALASCGAQEQKPRPMPTPPVIPKTGIVSRTLAQVSGLPALPDGERVTGQVLDEQHRPVTGADIVLRPGDRHTTSGADGAFAFDHVIGLEYLLATRVGARFAVGSRSEPTLVLRGGPTLLVHVVADGSPLEGATVTADGTVIAKSDLGFAPSARHFGTCDDSRQGREDRSRHRGDGWNRWCCCRLVQRERHRPPQLESACRPDLRAHRRHGRVSLRSSAAGR